MLTPCSPRCWSERYDFDLVPYYPLVLTAFSAADEHHHRWRAGRFLVLDEVDAGTLTALRVTPVPLLDFFAYRAATVMVVTTVYVDRDDVIGGILEPGLFPALIPIGLLAGCRQWLRCC